MTFAELAAAVGPHMPSAIPRSDESVCGGSCGVAKDFGVVSRINSVQAARYHRPVAVPSAVALITRSGRGGAEDGGNCKCDDGHHSVHGGFLLLADATRIESLAARARCKDRQIAVAPKIPAISWGLGSAKRPAPPDF